MAWTKGESGNKRGRPKKDFILAAECQKFTPEIVANMVSIMRGDPVKRGTGKFDDKGTELVKSDYPAFSDRVKAMEWLTDRGWGKAPTVLANPDLTPVTFTIAIDRKESEIDSPAADT